MSETKPYEEPEQAVNYFNHLPDEILYKIVSILPLFDLCTLAKVGQRFQKVCGDKRLWGSVSLVRQEITISQMEMLLTSSFPIQELNMQSCWIPDAQYHQEAYSSDSHTTLEKLDLTRFGYSHNSRDKHNDVSSSVLYILERCRAKKLVLNWVQDVDQEFLNSGLTEAISKHENLEVLSMERAFFLSVSFDDIRKLFNGCNRLRELNLSHCTLYPYVLRAVCDHIPETVEKLVLMEARYRYGGREFWQDALKESFGVLFCRAKNLKYFGAPFHHFQMPEIMNRIIQHQSLETLSFSACPYFLYSDTVGVLEILPPKLKKIEIFLPESNFTGRQHDWFLFQVEKVREAIIGIDVEVHEDRTYFSA